tara:strand:+ start:1284 stop:1778 length:495 start_codon:yes stop_codon:yes gene_type:complete
MTIEIEETTQGVDDLAREFAALTAEGEALDGEQNPLTGETPDKEPAELEIPTGELMAQVVQTTADIFAPNWEIQPDESEALGNAYGALLDKYMPDSGLDKWGLEITALMVTGMVIRSRAGVPLKKKPKSEKTRQGEKNEPEEKQEVKESEPKQEILNSNPSGVL